MEPIQDTIDRLAFALDVKSDRESIKEKLLPVHGKTGWVKINTVYTGFAREYAMDMIKDGGSKPFVDIKIHDIPTVAARHALEAFQLGARMITLHAQGTQKMMETVMSTLDKEVGSDRPIMLAVTLLTSIEPDILKNELKVRLNARNYVSHLAKLAQESGLDGVVCSAQEASLVRKNCGEDFIIFTPGIRFSGEQERDQARVGTPRGSIKAGATGLVMGSDLLKDPVNNIPRALREIELGIQDRSQ